MEVQVTVKVSPKFKILYSHAPDINTIVCIGGRGGGKTYEVSKFVAKSAAIDKKRCVVLRDEKALVKESILNEILARYDTADKDGYLSTECERLATGLKDRKTDKDLIFTKGFRASDNQKKANMKGVSDIDIAIIEEAEDITDEEKFDTFVDSLRKEGCLIIIMMNTPDIGHFLIKRYFNAVPAVVPGFTSAQLDGYFQLEPKTIKGFACSQTTYVDNRQNLPAHIIDNYEGAGNPEHHRFNLHYYFTAILGLASTGRKGQILRKVKRISLADYHALKLTEFYGQDFGTASPAGLVGVKFNKNKVYARQINYLPMPTFGLAKMYCTLKFGPNDLIIADNADEKAWKQLRDGYEQNKLSIADVDDYPGLLHGFHVKPCTKGKDSVTYGIDLIDTMELYVVEESTDFWHEINNWVYAKDKNDQYTNEPEDRFNHLIDPLRYVIVDQRGKNSDYNIYSG